MRIIAIDPSLRKTGFAIIDKINSDISSPRSGTIKNAQKLSQAQCLLNIFVSICDLCQEYRPEFLAMEAIIYVQSRQTAIAMGSARSPALIASAKFGIDVKEISPRKVKQAVVGYGNATKTQVAFMVKKLLNISKNLEPDEADALAVGMAFLFQHKIYCKQ